MEHSEERSQYDRWGLDAESSRGLELARIPDTGMCWWCGEQEATTAEHKYKVTDLRRMAEVTTEGHPDPSTLYRNGATFSRTLKTINRGTAVQWSKSLCKGCNGGRDHAMDSAYEIYSDIIWNNQDRLDADCTQKIDWRNLYGRRWREESRNLARYFAKQFGCMLAQQSLPAPKDAINFLNGASSPGTIHFTIVRDIGRRELRRIAREEGFDARGYWLPRTEGVLSPDKTFLVYADYEAYIGFIGVCVEYGVVRRKQFFKRRVCRIEDVACNDPIDIRRMVAQAVEK
jgi:hypothetical protein